MSGAWFRLLTQLCRPTSRQGTCHALCKRLRLELRLLGCRKLDLSVWVNRPIPAPITGDFMNQTNSLTPELIEAIQSVLEYLWEAERNDYEANPRPDHIFLALRTLCEIVPQPG